jgi:hypothetical protein
MDKDNNAFLPLPLDWKNQTKLFVAEGLSSLSKLLLLDQKKFLKKNNLKTSLPSFNFAKSSPFAVTLKNKNVQVYNQENVKKWIQENKTNKHALEILNGKTLRSSNLKVAKLTSENMEAKTTENKSTKIKNIKNIKNIEDITTRDTESKNTITNFKIREPQKQSQVKNYVVSTETESEMNNSVESDILINGNEIDDDNITGGNEFDDNMENEVKNKMENNREKPEHDATGRNESELKIGININKKTLEKGDRDYIQNLINHSRPPKVFPTIFETINKNKPSQKCIKTSHKSQVPLLFENNDMEFCEPDQIQFDVVCDKSEIF